MVTCPRCAQPVDETAYSACPHCSTPLPTTQMQAGGTPPNQPQPGQPYPQQPYPAAPGPASYGAQSPQGQTYPDVQGQQPYGAQTPPPQPYPGAQGQPLYGAPVPPPPPAYTPTPAPGTRVSLTGEVIESKAPSGPPPSYVGGGAARPVGTARPTTSRRDFSTEAPAKSGGGAGMVAGILLALVLIGGGIGAGWWFLVPHSNPKTVVQQFDTAFGSQDWKTVYNNMTMPDSEKSKYKDADAFAKDMTDNMQKARANPLGATILDAVFKAFQSAQVGEPTITGDTATVPVKMTISASVMGQNINRSMDNKIPLVKVNGVWKIDGSKGMMPSQMGGSLPGM